jgi:hypothetical protein
MHWTGTPARGSTVGALVETGWAFTDANGHRIRLPEAFEPAPPPHTATSLDPPATAA